ncbi:MAG: helix-turn-helix transcriptional regulator [Oscillospiraceae bacterium]|nr:helix-turn-helix transcriptional regulator [Oscillospiraceae bacterium]
MELHAQIKKYRAELGLSQEELAEQVYVTRQTVSNWENGKSYPDIHSLLLLSGLFQVSLDQLVKGDLETMKEIVNEYDLQEFKHSSNILAALFAGMLVCAPLVVLWTKWYTAVPCGLLFVTTIVWAWKVEKLKKKYDIQTYREIVAFSKGQKLDELEKATEKGKRPYQTVLSALLGAALGYGACALGAWLAKLLHLI